jgi:hypothetical protein
MVVRKGGSGYWRFNREKEEGRKIKRGRNNERKKERNEV